MNHKSQFLNPVAPVLEPDAEARGRGRALDCELKQFRFAGNIMMEVGAAIEVATAMAPGAFLPLACTANLVKNLAAVSASTTRAPIYRTFALQNNLADVSAKVCALAGGRA